MYHRPTSSLHGARVGWINIGLIESCARAERSPRLLHDLLALRGTPAAPEPLARRSHFYEDEELADLARQAGLAAVAVVSDDAGQLLTASTQCAARRPAHGSPVLSREALAPHDRQAPERELDALLLADARQAASLDDEKGALGAPLVLRSSPAAISR